MTKMTLIALENQIMEIINQRDTIVKMKNFVLGKIVDYPQIVNDQQKVSEVIRIMRLTGEFNHFNIDEKFLVSFCTEIVNPGFFENQFWAIKVAIYNHQ